MRDTCFKRDQSKIKKTPKNPKKKDNKKPKKVSTTYELGELVDPIAGSFRNTMWHFFSSQTHS